MEQKPGILYQEVPLSCIFLEMKVVDQGWRTFLSCGSNFVHLYKS